MKLYYQHQWWVLAWVQVTNYYYVIIFKVFRHGKQLSY